MLEKHELLTDHIGFAGGAWKWNGFAPLCVHSAYASREALPCCKEHGIKHVLVTAWGDNGAECSSFVTMPVQMCIRDSGGTLCDQDDKKNTDGIPAM